LRLPRRTCLSRTSLCSLSLPAQTVHSESI
jgi:hypothetical protein